MSGLSSKTRTSLTLVEQVSFTLGAVALAVGGYASYRDLKDEMRATRTDLGSRIQRLEDAAHIGSASGRPTLEDHVASTPSAPFGAH
jgi:hypothetical protein